jgi:thioredoxin-dependent peroxiredoxin
MPTRGGLLPSALMSIRTRLMMAAGVALSVAAGLTGLGQPSSVELKVGDAAPAFNLPGSDGKSYRLADYKGKSTVVLAWFPKAFTGG